MRKLLWVVVLVGLLLAALDIVEPVYVLAPLLGVAILFAGLASFGSLQRSASHVPDGEPAPIDTRVERVTYWCEGCGAELLLLVRGTETPPRHCGERMVQRREVARDALG